ncbi:hypothetical protein [Bacillus sp. Hm123]
MVQTFPYDETEHERYEIVKERAEIRKEAIEAMQKEFMCHDPRFDDSHCE